MVLPLLFIFCVLGTAQPPANLQVISDLALKIADEGIPSAGCGDSIRVLVVPLSPTCEWNWVVERALLQRLDSRKGRDGAVMVSVGEAPDSGWCLVAFAPENLSIRYEKAGRRLVRHVRLSLYLRITGPGGKVMQSASWQRDYMDQIDQNDLSNVESSAWPFTRGLRPPRRWLSSLVEPFLIATITGGIIYLFYSFRTLS